MVGVIIAAGYATRLYPLTEHFPKPLLEIGNTTILDRLLDQLHAIPALDRIVLITNHKFFHHFEEWEKGYNGRFSITLIDNHTTSKDDRLGAVGDIAYALEHGNIDDDILVCAADNIITFSLDTYIQTYAQTGSVVIGARVIEDFEDRKRRGIVSFNEDHRVTNFEEKPENPQSHWAVPPFYLYPKSVLPLFTTFLAEGNNPDAPGHFIGWLYKKQPIHVVEIEGKVHDIGNKESLAEAEKIYGSRT